MSKQFHDCTRALGRTAQIVALALLPLACSASQNFSADDEIRAVETEEHALAVSVVVDGLKQAWSIAELPETRATMNLESAMALLPSRAATTTLTGCLSGSIGVLSCGPGPSAGDQAPEA